MRACRWTGIWLVAWLIAAPAGAGELFGNYDVEYLDVPTQGAGLTGITTGMSGDIWFTEQSQDRVGRYSPDSGFEEFVIPMQSLPSFPGLITPGGDGNFWFTQFNSDAIGRITPDGMITNFPLPGQFSAPIDITKGPDGNVWYSARGPTRGVGIGWFTPTGELLGVEFDDVTFDQDEQSLQFANGIAVRVRVRRGKARVLWTHTAANPRRPEHVS